MLLQSLTWLLPLALICAVLLLMRGGWRSVREQMSDPSLPELPPAEATRILFPFFGFNFTDNRGSKCSAWHQGSGVARVLGDVVWLYPSHLSYWRRRNAIVFRIGDLTKADGSFELNGVTLSMQGKLDYMISDTHAALVRSAGTSASGARPSSR